MFLKKRCSNLANFTGKQTPLLESLFITVKDPQACNCVYERLQQENLRNFKNTLFWRASADDASSTNFGISRDFFLLLSKNETAVIFCVFLRKRTLLKKVPGNKNISYIYVCFSIFYTAREHVGSKFRELHPSPNFQWFLGKQKQKNKLYVASQER